MIETINQAIILAGGKGERLRPFTDTLPKPLYPINGIPFINRLIKQIAEFGIKDVVILLGYLADKVVEELGNGEQLGVEIRYDIAPVEYDTGDRLLHAKGLLADRFLLMYCDNYCPIDFKKLVDYSVKNEALLQMSVYSNKDGYTKNNLKLDNNGLVEIYDKARKSEGLAGVDIGYAIVKKETLNLLREGSFAAEVYPKLVADKKMFATVTDHRYYSIGSYERLPLTEEFFRPKNVVFLDRDGTLNVRPPKACYIEKPEDFVWLPGAKEAVKMLNDHGVITILVSNQPGIARGRLTEKALTDIHNKMQNDLAEIDAKIDHIYYCPHNWDEGCDCRKPKPGLLYQAQKDLSLDLTKCMLFGDDDRDIEAADAANCPAEQIKEGCSLLQAVKKYCKELKGK